MQQFPSSFNFGININPNACNASQIQPLPTVVFQSSAQSNLNNYESPMEAPLHDIIKQSVEEFKVYWKEQKAMRDEISLFSDKDLNFISTEIQNSQTNLDQLITRVVKTALATQNLKDKILQEVKQVEYSSRIKESSSIYNNFNMPDFEYFNSLVIGFQEQMAMLRQNFEDVKLILDSISSSTKQGIVDSRALVEISKYLQESIICAASNLQSVHEIIQGYKIGGIGFGKILDTSHLLQTGYDNKPTPLLVPGQISRLQDLTPRMTTTSSTMVDGRRQSATTSPYDTHFVERGKNYYACLLQAPRLSGTIGLERSNLASISRPRSQPVDINTSPPPTNLRGIIKRSVYSPSL